MRLGIETPIGGACLTCHGLIPYPNPWLELNALAILLSSWRTVSVRIGTNVNANRAVPMSLPTVATESSSGPHVALAPTTCRVSLRRSSFIFSECFFQFRCGLTCAPNIGMLLLVPLSASILEGLFGCL